MTYEYKEIHARIGCKRVSKPAWLKQISTKDASILHKKNSIRLPSVETLRKTLFIGAADPSILGNGLVGTPGLHV